MNLHDRDIMRAARQEGLLQGAAEAKSEAAKNLLNMNILSSEQIAQTVGLPLENVLELQKSRT
ncbi:MAG: hypothetical protein IJ530_15435 [Treponema sp.]|uniref:hypothetical protein n=1 Tax=Treponema sp. TaxID=166 RepID=UPI0025D079E3|nr:hypothetical protein [Treponema sp.]MBQ8681123.1 hypothetical protein [Treponema sp.]